ncbi:aspartic peptidase domain-containing protein [Bombardia bombarda]|uniref:Aspartic peptidase domain-containing protein n=1 Tax=Bombardia bombarda TaxID=252184 RepID=A0AA40CDK7_9PEZI|nr:aspartic peptidase domain-containing protein [Bombardia bombarda]
MVSPTATLSWFLTYGLLATALPNTHLQVLKSVTAPGIGFKIPKATHPWTAAAGLPKQSKNVQRIHSNCGSKTNSKSVAAIIGAHQRQVGGYGYQNVTSTSAFGTQYAIEAVWNGTRMMLIVDTGSSDTWVVRKGFSCVDYHGESVPQVACGFGPAYPKDFQYGLTSPEEHMFIQYGDGETVTGPMGFSDITLGNITVKKQQVSLANTTYWVGNNQTSGLIGLAFPSLTNAYLGSSDDHDPGNQIEYSPLFSNMVNQGTVAPLFSIAIDRNASTGLLAWGGIPPVTGLDNSRTATLDMIITNLIDKESAAYEYSFYTVIPDGWQFGQTSDLTKYPFIVDTGTTICYLPPNLADAINRAFTPAGVYLWMYGAYFTSCDAVAPRISVILGGVHFWINPRDLIYQRMVDPLTGLCMTAIASGGSGPYILGDAFLQNALAVFDVGQAKMRFIPREFY